MAFIARIESDDATASVETLRTLVEAAGFRLHVDIVQQPTPDPVIEAYKRDVDQTLLIENLRKTPEERVKTLEAMARLAAEMASARERSAK